MANVTHAAVVSAFEKRYDYQSARTVLADALKTGGMAAKDAYSDAEVAQIGELLKALGESAFEVVVESLSGPAPAPAAPAAEAKKDDAKKDEKKDDAKDEKKPAKKDDAKKKK